MTTGGGPILINARAARRARITGVERWAREMTGRLPQLRPAGYRVVAPPAALAHRAGHAWEQGVLPVLAAAARAPALFSPANAAPLAWRRNVVVIHDALPLRHPELFSRAYAAWHGRLTPLLARRALAIITVSTFSRRELAALTGRDEEAIHVVAGGVDERFTPDADAERAASAHRLLKPYVLTVAGEGVRKNLGALAPAARELAAAGSELVIAGAAPRHLGAHPDLPGVRTLGYVPDDDLPGLYAGARAFVLPSRYEGFGLTCVEAMASGTPVVAADRGALPETCGEAALLVDPDDPSAIAAGVLQAAHDERVRARLREAGLRRAAQLGWQRAAVEVDALLARLTGC